MLREIRPPLSPRRSRGRILLIGLSVVAAVGAGLAGRDARRQSAAEAGTPATEQGILGEATGVADSVELIATNLRIEGDRFLADVCFEMPDGSDWTIWEASLMYPGGVIDAFGLTLIELWEPAIDGRQQVVSGTKEVTVIEVSGEVPGRRCDTLYFYLPADIPQDAFTIRIEAVAAPPREGETCLAENLQRVRAAMAVRGPGIVIGCEQGSGYEGLVLVSWPEGMSRSAAEAIAFGGEVFLDAHGRRGPWVFEFPGS